ncbi:NAD(+) diphosphatase [Rhodococcus aerolatus]
MTAVQGTTPGDFTLDETPLLSRSTTTRGDAVRHDAEATSRSWREASLLKVDRRMGVATAGGSLVLTDAIDHDVRPPAEAVVLGEEGVGGGRAVWAVPVRELELSEGQERSELRAVGALLDDTQAGLLTTAVAALTWHAMAGFCAVCGGSTVPQHAGWTRQCTVCGRDEYPRTDPAIICLVHDGADQVLLGRQNVWPQGRFSVLAGFVEAGESLEACVHREIEEEVGVTIQHLRYLGSQPWPFPRSIMLGFHATADPSQQVVPEEAEIAEAHWFTREQVREALALGEWVSLDDVDPGERPALLLPGSISIARKMLEAWADAG